MARITFYEKLPTIRQLKQLVIKEALNRTHGDPRAAADMAAISQPTLKKYLRKIGVVKYVPVIFFICLFSDSARALEPENYLKSQVVVRVAADTPDEKMDMLLETHQLTVKERIPQLRIYVLGFSTPFTVPEMVSKLSAYDFVESCEPDYVNSVQDEPDDPLFINQWGLYNAYSTSADIDILNAWAVTEGDPEIIVSVIDMGFDMTHEDLQDNLWHNPGEIPDNGVDDDQNGYVDDIVGWDFVNQTEGLDDPESDYRDEDNDPTYMLTSHGNRVWGIIGATVDNGIGIAGIAGKCKVMLIRAGFHNTDGMAVLSSSHIAKGIVYSVDNGARVINISSGSQRYSESYKVTLSYAVERQVLVVASAGNEGTGTPCYPAAYDIPGIISVGASTPADERAGFSNYGSWVDVSAPGLYIMTTLLDNSYGETQGTSFSAPIVAGIAALLFSEYPDWTPSMVQDRIMNTVDIRTGLETANITSGRVNAYRALTDASGDSYTGAGDDLFFASGTTNSKNGCFISSL